MNRSIFQIIINTVKNFFYDLKVWFKRNRGRQKRILTSPFKFITFLIIIIIQTLILPIYLINFIFFLLNWKFKLIKYIYDSNVKELKPKLNNFSSENVFIFYIYVHCIWKPYLISFFVIYNLVYSLKNSNKVNIENKITILLNFTLSIFIKIITGISKNIFKTAFYYAAKLQKPKNYQDFRDSIHLDLLIITLQEFLYIEKMKIYKNDLNKWNFNPPKIIYKINHLNNINHVYKNKDFESILLKKLDNDDLDLFSYNYDTYKDLVQTKNFKIINTSDKFSHYSHIFNILDSKNNYILGANYTTKDSIKINNTNTYHEHPLKLNYENNEKPQLFTNYWLINKDCLEYTHDKKLDQYDKRILTEKTELTYSHGYLNFFFEKTSDLKIINYKGFNLIENNYLKNNKKSLYKLISDKDLKNYNLYFDEKKLNEFQKLDYLYNKYFDIIGENDFYIMMLWLSNLEETMETTGKLKSIKKNSIICDLLKENEI